MAILLFESTSEALKKHANVLDDARYAHEAFNPTTPSPRVEGKINGYRAGFGVRHISQEKSSTVYAFFLCAKLQNPPKMPFMLKNDFALDQKVDDHLGLKLQWGWLVRYKFLDESPAECVANLESKYLANIRADVAELVETAQRFDQGDADFLKRIAKAKKKSRGDLILFVIAAMALLGLIFLRSGLFG